jgi:hypothetical protein
MFPLHALRSLETEELCKVLNAHFQRIIDIRSLVVGKENAVITSSIDRSIKVWNLDYIFEVGEINLKYLKQFLENRI